MLKFPFFVLSSHVKKQIYFCSTLMRYGSINTLYSYKQRSEASTSWFCILWISNWFNRELGNSAAGACGYQAGLPGNKDRGTFLLQVSSLTREESWGKSKEKTSILSGDNSSSAWVLLFILTSWEFIETVGDRDLQIWGIFFFNKTIKRTIELGSFLEASFHLRWRRKSKKIKYH